MSSPLPVTLVGATGLTGSATLKALLQSLSPSNVTAITRRPLAAPVAPASTATIFENKVLELAHDKAATWGEISKPAGAFISCLGTTKAAAGSLENQEKIDVFLNKALAEKAKADGAETEAIIVSSNGASSASRMSPYLRFKGEFEDAVKSYGFKTVVILQPGLLLGEREESRTLEGVFQSLFKGARSLGVPISRLAVDAEDIGACITHLVHNPPTEPVSVLGNSEIIAFAQKEKAARAA